ncbi:helix-turn-helix domain-containing protein [Maridesulfovibrio sp.]|uniref:helix-turn-helix domain-containing protein n=1 Tax=Maridesulfovibrio sp. TaxID=2795000 RepID=UPI003BA9C5F8
MIEVKNLPQGQHLDIELLDRGMEPQSLSPHRHEYYEMFWTLEGKGSHSVDFIEYPLQPGLIYCIPPGQVHHCRDLPHKLYAISFDGSFLNSDHRTQQDLKQLFRPDPTHNPPLQIDNPGRQELLQLITIMNNELGTVEPDNSLLSILLAAFIRYLTRYQNSSEDGPHFSDERITKLLALIEEQHMNHKDAGYYSEQLSLTSKRVNELTRLYLSKTVTQLIHDRIILEARRELAFTHKTIKAISLDLGYADTAYFCRFFRNQTGESPRTFRNRWQYGCKTAPAQVRLQNCTK